MRETIAATPSKYAFPAAAPPTRGAPSLPWHRFMLNLVVPGCGREGAVIPPHGQHACSAPEEIDGSPGNHASGGAPDHHIQAVHGACLDNFLPRRPKTLSPLRITDHNRTAWHLV